MSSLVYKNILDKNNLSKSDLLDLISNLYFKGLSYGDLYFQSSIVESLFLEEKLIKNNSISINNGVGIRVISGDQVSFSCSSNINFKSILNLINNIKNIYSNVKFKKKKNIFFIPEKEFFYKNKNSINFSSNKNKVDLLFYLDNYIRKINSYVNYVSINLINNYEIILVVSNEGVCIGDVRPLIDISFKVKLEKNNYQEIGFSGGGGRYSYEDLISKYYNGELIIEHWAKEAIRIGMNNLYAVNAPSGKFPVILGSGSPGVLLHEAIGHGLEGDFIRKGISIYSNLINTKIASDLCTIVDDSTLLNLRGSLNIDDEGILGKKNILVENGILKSFILDKFNASLMNMKSTGNARRESYRCLPIPRMTNTFLLNGSSSFLNLIESVDYGIYIANLSSGQVDITSGKFVFTILEGYLIKKGKICNPIKGATLIGSVFEVMNNISMIANDFSFDYGNSMCGKDDQVVPVSVGQPSLKIDSMIIGGLNKI